MSAAEPTVPAADFVSDIVSFIEADVALDDDPIDSTTDLLLSGLVDSLGVMLITEWMQERLGIVIDPVDIVLENFQTVDLMLAYAESRGAVAAA